MARERWPYSLKSKEAFLVFLNNPPSTLEKEVLSVKRVEEAAFISFTDSQTTVKLIFDALKWALKNHWPVSVRYHYHESGYHLDSSNGLKIIEHCSWRGDFPPLNRNELRQLTGRPLEVSADFELGAGGLAVYVALLYLSERERLAAAVRNNVKGALAELDRLEGAAIRK